MLRQKRGIALASLVLILLAIAGFVSILIFLMSSQEKAADLSEVNACRGSIITRASFAINQGKENIYFTPLLCRTRDTKVAGSREELKAVFAHQMATCWYMFDEGRWDDILNTGGLEKMFGWKTDSQCFLCNTAVINQDEIEGGPIEAPEMFEYLKTTPHHRYNKMTYLEYFQNFGGPGAVAILDTIHPENAYGVVFSPRKENTGGIGLVDYAAGGAGAVGVTAAAVGVAVCIIAEPCGLIAAGAAAGLIAGGTVVAGTSGTYLASHAANVLEVKKEIYKKDRKVSMVFLDDMKGVEAGGCVVEDTAGK